MSAPPPPPPVYYPPPPQPVKSGGNIGWVLGAVAVLFIIVIVIALSFRKKKKEGDQCKVKNPDSNGVYEYDSKLECVLSRCSGNFIRFGDICEEKLPEGENDEEIARVFPLSYLYVPQVLKTPSGGFGDSYALGGEQYMSSIDCEMRCSEDDDCVAAMYTDTVNHDANDHACYGIKAGTGSKTYGVHTHYSTLVKEPFAQGVVENPKFVDGKAVVAGTPWAGTTGWETKQSSSAHPTAYLSWHPFSKDGTKQWASWSADPDCFVSIKYPREVVLKGYVVASTSDANNYTPAKVALEGSKDGTTWTKIKETTTPEPSRVVGYSKNRTSIIAREKLDANTTGYTHYRARIPDSNGNYNNLTEVRLYTTLGDYAPAALDICINAGDTPGDSVWDFHGSASAATSVADLVSRWTNETIVNGTGVSAKSLGYKWVCMLSDSACMTYFVFTKDKPTETIVDDKYCSYTNDTSTGAIPQGIKALCSSLNPSTKIDGHPYFNTWRCIDLSNPSAASRGVL